MFLLDLSLLERVIGNIIYSFCYIISTIDSTVKFSGYLDITPCLSRKSAVVVPMLTISNRDLSPLNCLKNDFAALGEQNVTVSILLSTIKLSKYPAGYSANVV